jgi:hypothetical protein
MLQNARPSSAQNSVLFVDAGQMCGIAAKRRNAAVDNLCFSSLARDTRYA